MKLNKLHVIIIVFIIFWAVVIGWGMLKTSQKLIPPKTAGPAGSEGEKEIQRVTTKKKKAEEKGPEKKEIKISLEELLKAQILMVRIFKSKATDFNDLLPIMGTIKGNKEVELRFEVTGKIKEIKVREGDRVNKGQLIARLDPKESLMKIEYYKAKMRSYQAAYEAVKKRSQLIEELYKTGTIISLKLEEARLECDKAKLEWETAVQELNIAQNELGKNIILAPIDGVITAMKMEVGEFVSPNNKVAVLIDVNEVIMEAGIIERDIEKIKLKQKAEVYVDAYPDEKFSGVIDNIFPVIEGKSRTLTVQVKLANPKNLLLPGMFSRANIFLVELKNAIIIPTKSVIKTGPNILVVPVVSCGAFPPEEVEKGNQIGTLELRRVKRGYATPDYTQITAGLNAGEFVVIESQGELMDGTKAKVAGIEELAEEGTS